MLAPEPLMTASELRTARIRLGMSQRELAQHLHVTYHTVWRYEHGLRPVPGYCITVVHALLQALSEHEQEQQRMLDMIRRNLGTPMAQP